MYDLVHRYAPEVEARWVPRHEVKAVPKEGEALKLANMEVRWWCCRSLVATIVVLVVILVLEVLVAREAIR